MCVLTLILFYMPDILQRRLRVYLPDALEIIILVFIFAAEILGEIQSFYVKIPIWDTLLHTTTGFLAAAVGFSMVDLLNRNEQFSIKMSPIYMAVAAFCFSMTIGVMWEFFEFAMDVFFGMDTQKDTVISGFSSVLLNPEPVNEAIKYRDITSTAVNGQDLGINGYLDIGLYDTMMDLLVNFIGAVVFSVIGFFYVKYRERHSFVDKIIPKPQGESKS
jgi:hypothetical protein